MLCLSRKVGEVIYIVNEDTGDVITLTVNDIQRGAPPKVSLGIDADQHYRIIRKELYDRSKLPKTETQMPVAEQVVVDRGIHFNEAV
jgi:carbon storage regulator CsrA